jgi:hypothetical protein
LLTSAFWPLVGIVLVLIFARPVRRLVNAVTQRVEKSASGKVSSPWFQLSWEDRVDRVLGPLEQVEAVRSGTEARVYLNTSRIEVSTPADVIIEAHGAVLVAVRVLSQTGIDTDKGFVSLAAKPLIDSDRIDQALIDAVSVLDDLYSIAQIQGANLDGRNADEYLRLAQSVLERLPPPGGTL